MLLGSEVNSEKSEAKCTATARYLRYLSLQLPSFIPSTPHIPIHCCYPEKLQIPRAWVGEGTTVERES